MKKILVVINFILLVFVTIFIYKKVNHKVPKNCNYSLSAFDFHYKKQTDTPAIVMLGDSRIGQGNWNDLLSRTDVINRGIYGDKMYCICNRLNYLKNPFTKICFIEGGLLDMRTEEVDSIVSSYKKIVSFWQSNKVIPVINTIVHISQQASPQYGDANKKIALVNDKLKLFAKQNSIDIIDMNLKLTNEATLLLKPEFSADGAHFNQKAYELWAKEVNTILKRNKI
ncbi:MAG: hypothetical protein ACOVO1_09145 [Chitinophagaceae bacterium]